MTDDELLQDSLAAVPVKEQGDGHLRACKEISPPDGQGPEGGQEAAAVFGIDDCVGGILHFRGQPCGGPDRNHRGRGHRLDKLRLKAKAPVDQAGRPVRREQAVQFRPLQEGERPAATAGPVDPGRFDQGAGADLAMDGLEDQHRPAERLAAKVADQPALDHVQARMMGQAGAAVGFDLHAKHRMQPQTLECGRRQRFYDVLGALRGWHRVPRPRNSGLRTI